MEKKDSLKRICTGCGFPIPPNTLYLERHVGKVLHPHCGDLYLIIDAGGTIGKDE